METICNVKVRLSGTDGNAFAIIGKVSKAMRKAKIENEIIQAFQHEAMSGDYNHLLQTCMKYVDVS